MLRWVLLAVLLGACACASAGQKQKKVGKNKPHPLSRGVKSVKDLCECYLLVLYVLIVWKCSSKTRVNTVLKCENCPLHDCIHCHLAQLQCT